MLVTLCAACGDFYVGHVLCTSLRPRGVEYAQGRQEREEEGEGDVVVMFVVMGGGRVDEGSHN